MVMKARMIQVLVMRVVSVAKSGEGNGVAIVVIVVIVSGGDDDTYIDAD